MNLLSLHSLNGASVVLRHRMEGFMSRNNGGRGQVPQEVVACRAFPSWTYGKKSTRGYL